MSVKSTAVILCVAISLSGCVIQPYVGKDSKDGSTCVDVGMPIATNHSSCLSSSAYDARKHPTAPNSSKRVKYTEAERRAMAREAVALLYPWSEADKLSLATGAAELIVNDQIPSAHINECAMLVADELRYKLVDKLPKPEVFYKDGTNNLLLRYSDDQLELILNQATKSGPNTWLQSELRPQPPVFGGSIRNMPLPSLVKFISKTKK